MKKLLLLFALWSIGIAGSFAFEAYSFTDSRGVTWSWDYVIYDIETTDDWQAEIVGASGYGTEVEVPGTVYDDKETARSVIRMSSAFKGNTELQKVILPSTVIHLDSTFCGCSALTTVENTSQITEMGDSVFYGCKSLTSIDLSSVISLGKWAFCGSGLTAANLPVCKTVEDLAFNYCAHLASVNLPGCESVGDWAFNGCTSLTAMNLPACTTVGGGAFEGCRGLTSIDLPACTTVGWKTFSDCTSLASVKLPSCKSIGGYAFSEGDIGEKPCIALASVELPVCTEIGNNAFAGCIGLTNIDIPSSVTSIGSKAYENCSGLTRIDVYWDTPLDITADVFSGVDKQKCTLCVPQGTCQDYRNAVGWGEFQNIEERESTGIGNTSVAVGAAETARYSANGQQVTAPVKGLNIVEYSDGSTRKVVVK